MTPTRGTFYGVVAVFISLIIMTSSLALYYYGQSQQTASQNREYVAELNTALATYRSLSGSFNSSLSDYGRTLELLSSAVSNLNTSTPAYSNASIALASLWDSYQQLSSLNGKKVLVYEVHMLVGFGNGTSKWYNKTAAQPGWNGYVATLVLLKGKVQAVWYPQYGEHFVTAVDGVPQTSTDSWFFWSFSAGKWTPAESGADGIRINNGTSIAWTLCGYDLNFNPTCSP